MSHLDTRSRDILMVLLQENVPIPVKDIASHLHITPRMIRPNLDIIDRWLKNRGAELIRKPNFGVYIEAASPQKASIIQELSKKDDYLLYLSTGERIDVIILMLLREGENPLSIEHIETTLGISRPTIYKDISKVENWLSLHGLKLIHQPRAGFQIQCSEECWREAIISFILVKFDLISLLSMCIDKEAKFNVHAASNLSLLNKQIIDVLQYLDLSHSYILLKKLEYVTQRKFTDVSFVSLVCYLALAFARVSQGKIIDSMSTTTQQHIPENISLAVEQITDEIRTRFSIELNQCEEIFFIQQILGAKIQYTFSDIAQSQQSSLDQFETDEIVESIINEASLYLHPYLKVDRQLIRALTFHIQVALNRLRFNLTIENPLKEAVETRYPYISDVAHKSISLFEEKIQKPVPEGEIAFITMHLGAAMERLRPYLKNKRKVWIVCAEGAATAWLLVSRLQAEIPELEVLEVTSTLEVLQKPPEARQIDAILTTVPLNIPGIYTLIVSPLLCEEDKTRIREVLNISSSKKMPTRKMDDSNGLSLATLITVDTMKFNVKAGSWEEVVEISGKLLMNVHSINHRYIQAMKDVIHRFGPYVVFTPGVALLHARPEDGVHRMCMSLITLNPPVHFNHPNNDPVHIAIALAVADNFSHLRALAQLANLLSASQYIRKIKSAKSKEEILHILMTET